MTKGNLSFNITKNHPDYKIARAQANEARRLYNTINAVYNERERVRTGKQSQSPISNSMNVLPTDKLEAVRKKTSASIGVLLPEKVGQSVSRTVGEAWSSVIKLRSKGFKAGNVNYQRKYGKVRFTKQSISQKKNLDKVIPSGWEQGVKLPEHVKLSQVQAVELSSYPDGFRLNVLYNDKVVAEYSPSGEVWAAGDLGVNNFLTIIVDRTGYRPKIVSGKGVKSKNRYYNKAVGKLNARISRETDRVLRNRLVMEKRRLFERRDREFGHFVNVASNEVVRTLMAAGVTHFVIGWSDGFKLNSRMSRKNNQSFVQLPHAKFRNLLQRKLGEVGIIVEIQEESYTSKASFLDGDFIPVYNGKPFLGKFSGRRVSRGMYKAKNGSLIHADVNGAWNILRKCRPFIGRCSGVVVTPERLRLIF